MSIEVKECKVEEKEEVRTFPCLLKGVFSGNYYYATSERSGFGLTLGKVLPQNYSSFSNFKEVDCLTLSLKK